MHGNSITITAKTILMNFAAAQRNIYVLLLYDLMKPIFLITNSCLTLNLLVSIPIVSKGTRRYSGPGHLIKFYLSRNSENYSGSEFLASKHVSFPNY